MKKEILTGLTGCTGWRRFLSTLHPVILSASILFSGLFLVQLQAEELIPDNQFHRGFVLYEPKPGAHVRYGEMRGLETNSKPSWALLQWSSKFPFKVEASAQLADGTLIYSNAAKSVVIAPDYFSMSLNSAVEYGPVARKGNEPWIHLLVEQQVFARPPKLSEISSAKLHVEAKLVGAQKITVAGYTPDLHAAQFQIFFTVQNLNRKSPGFGDLVWFGVPIYDDRHRIPPAFKEQDWGGTAKFIFTPDGTNYLKTSVQDGGWVVIDRDVLPLMKEALETAWGRGFLSGSKDLADYSIGGMNMGWEVTGHFEVEMRVRGLKMELKRK